MDTASNASPVTASGQHRRCPPPGVSPRRASPPCVSPPCVSPPCVSPRRVQPRRVSPRRVPRTVGWVGTVLITTPRVGDSRYLYAVGSSSPAQWRCHPSWRSGYPHLGHG